MQIPQLSNESLAALHAMANPFEDLNDVVIRLTAEVRDHRERCAASAPEAQSHNLGAGRPQRRKKRRKTMTVLLEAGVLAPGVELVLCPTRFPSQVEFDLDERRYRCHVSANPTSRENVVWQADGHAYPLSRVTEMLRDRDELPFIAGALNGFGWWALASDPTTSLWDLAEALGR